jgi:hypothetical protein
VKETIFVTMIVAKDTIIDLKSAELDLIMAEVTLMEEDFNGC